MTICTSPLPFSLQEREKAQALGLRGGARYANFKSQSCCWIEKLNSGQTLEFREFYPFGCHGKATPRPASEKRQRKRKAETEPVRDRRGGNTLENAARVTGEGGIDEIKRTINRQRTV